jgi:hypothetical protein
MYDKHCVKTSFLVVVSMALQLIEQSHCSLSKKTTKYNYFKVFKLFV